MAVTSRNKLDTTALAVLLPRLELSPEAAACLVGCALPSEALERLATGALPIEAARLCAHALPAREAVWWATRCALATAPADLPRADQEARTLAETWVRQCAEAARRSAGAAAAAGIHGGAATRQEASQNTTRRADHGAAAQTDNDATGHAGDDSTRRADHDSTRRAAMDKAQLAGCTSPEAWAAVAAFWSGDSMSPPGQPKVPPAPHLTGVAAAGSVILASVRGDPTRQPDRLARFLDSARDIAAGGAGHLPQETA